MRRCRGTYVVLRISRHRNIWAGFGQVVLRVAVVAAEGGTNWSAAQGTGEALLLWRAPFPHGRSGYEVMGSWHDSHAIPRKTTYSNWRFCTPSVDEIDPILFKMGATGHQQCGADGSVTIGAGSARKCGSGPRPVDIPMAADVVVKGEATANFESSKETRGLFRIKIWSEGLDEQDAIRCRRSKARGWSPSYGCAYAIKQRQRKHMQGLFLCNRRNDLPEHQQ